MNTITIGNETKAGKNVRYPVRLDGKLVGAIRRTWDASGHGQYQYWPTGAKKGGEQFLSLRSCARSLHDDEPESTPELVDAKTVKCGPITWTRDTSTDEESWDATLTGSRESDRELKLTCLYIKNYGRKRAHDRSDRHGFVGWQVGSGGPFEWMGDHTASHLTVIRAATPYVVDYWRQQARERLAQSLDIAGKLGVLLLNSLKG